MVRSSLENMGERRAKAVRVQVEIVVSFMFVHSRKSSWININQTTVSASVNFPRRNPSFSHGHVTCVYKQDFYNYVLYEIYTLQLS